MDELKSLREKHIESLAELSEIRRRLDDSTDEIHRQAAQIGLRDAIIERKQTHIDELHRLFKASVTLLKDVLESPVISEKEKNEMITICESLDSRLQ